MLATAFSLTMFKTLYRREGRLFSFFRQQQQYSSSINYPNPVITQKGGNVLLEKRRIQKKKSTWRLYPADFVFKNLQPDKVPESYKMVYRNDLETYANLSILATGPVTLAATVLMLKQLFDPSPSLTLFEICGYSAGIYLTAASMCYLALQVPMRIYYSAEENNFLFYVPTIIPFRTTKLVVRPGQLLSPSETRSILFWLDLHHSMRGSRRKFIINSEGFILPMYYNRLMGYQ